MLSAYIDWEKEESLIVHINFLVENKIWVLKELSDIIFSMWIDVDAINTKKIWNTRTKIDLDLRILDYDYLLIDRFVERVKIHFKNVLHEYSLWNIKKI